MMEGGLVSISKKENTSLIAQFVTNCNVILKFPDTYAEFCMGQSHAECRAADFDKLSTSKQETSKTNRTCPSSAYFVR